MGEGGGADAAILTPGAAVEEAGERGQQGSLQNSDHIVR
jgi:hypothetical protein